MSGTLIDLMMKFWSLQGNILSSVIIPQLSDKDPQKKQCYTLKISFQLLKKKLLFISPSAAAMFICKDKGIMSHKKRIFIEMYFSSI